MDTVTYVTLTRQTALRNEMQVVANNVANMATTGFRAEGVVFAEHLEKLATDGGSVAMTTARGRFVNNTQGALAQTGGTYDFAISGPGYFQVEAPQGLRLTRSGAFATNQNSELVTLDGHRVLDAGGAPIFMPPNAASILVSKDGTISADGQLQGRLGIFSVDSPNALTRDGSNLLHSATGAQPLEDGVVFQGFLENSNVNPVVEIARMIEVQRAYELGQKLLNKEDQRVRETVRTLGQSA